MKTLKFTLVLFLFCTLSTTLFAQQKTSYKFFFGAGKTAKDFIKVDPSTTYSKETRYGFDFGTKPVSVDRSGRNPLKAGFCTSEKPFYFSVQLPEGNYNVTITMGDIKEASITTVKAESRRLMLEKIQTKPGKFETRTFTINTRIPQIAGTDEKVGLKPQIGRAHV